MTNPFQGIIDVIREANEQSIAKHEQAECSMCGALHAPGLTVGKKWFCSMAHYDEWRQFDYYEREWEKPE
jgi:hypothetical protein